ncbi:MAG: hypothetical protein DHS20C05_09520 [Hyphococcus sp.]|nr:MAG: hypothetical protein DHS20C05_09520 [Marinicaulis sp.]
MVWFNHSIAATQLVDGQAILFDIDSGLNRELTLNIDLLERIGAEVTSKGSTWVAGARGY